MSTVRNTTVPKLSRRSSQTQRGSVLLISLIILLVLTVLGISSMTSSTLEEKMSGNTRDQIRAFQAAEISLHRVEDIVDAIASVDAFGENVGLYEEGNHPDINDPITWNDENSAQLPAGTVDDVSSQPRYIVEHMGSEGAPDINVGGYGESSGVGEIDTFRITVRATGGTDDAVVFLQAHYR